MIPSLPYHFTLGDRKCCTASSKIEEVLTSPYLTLVLLHVLISASLSMPFLLKDKVQDPIILHDLPTFEERLGRLQELSDSAAVFTCVRLAGI